MHVADMRYSEAVVSDVDVIPPPVSPTLSEARQRSLANLRSWKKGQSGNPNGTPGPIKEFHRLLRSNEPKVIDELIKLITEEKDGYLRLAAIHEFFNRLYGKPIQPIANASEEGKPAIAIQILAHEAKY